MIFDTDFYFAEKQPRPRNTPEKELKKPLLHSWNKTDIQPTNCYDLFCGNGSPEAYCKAHKHIGGIWHIVTQLKTECQKNKKSFESWTRPYCIIDIDDQALKKPDKEKENNLYNPELDNIQDVKTRYALSYKILNALLNDNKPEYRCTHIWKSTKGFHILARFNKDTVKFLTHTELKLSSEFCNKHDISESERERANIDILQHHQVLKQGYDLKQHRDVKTTNVVCDVLEIPSNFVIDPKAEKDVYEQIILNIHQSYKPKMFIADSFKKNYVKDAFRQYLAISGITYNSQHKILCPFHAEKTASCHIDFNKNVFHCFGCKQSGNLTQFIAKIKNISNKEANKILDDLNLRE
jgi:hypothetical protein